MIIPRPKVQKNEKGFFEGALRYGEADGRTGFAADFLRLLVPMADCSVGGDVNFVLRHGEMPADGAYVLDVNESKVTVSCKDREGARNAMSTLAQLMRSGRIPCTHIEDAPDFPFRSCMLDLARGYVEMPVLKEHLLRLAAFKYNLVHFHLMDSACYVLESDVVPKTADRQYYSQEEMRDMVSFCARIGLEVIPEIEIPAHASNTIRQLPELACVGSQSDWVMCLGKETTYEIFDRIIDELCGIFGGRYIHMGGDELEFPDLGRVCSWTSCLECRTRMEREGLKTITDLYYYMVKRIHESVVSRGKRLMMWNDQLDVSKAVNLPKDILVEFWRIAAAGRGPYEGCTFQKLLDQGFEVVNAQYQYTYVDRNSYMSAEKIRAWTPFAEWGATAALRGNIAGGEMCAWELGNPEYSFYACTLAPSVGFFADRLWNGGVTEYNDEYLEALFLSCLGGGPAGLNVLKVFPTVIPPRRKVMLEAECAAIDKKEARLVAEKLRSVPPASIYGRLLLDAYIRLLEVTGRRGK